MKPRNFKRWTRALRDPKHAQMRGRLVGLDANGGIRYCALGVAALVAGDEIVVHEEGWVTIGGAECLPSPRVFRSLGLKPRGGDVDIDIPVSLKDRDGVPLAGDCSYFNDTVQLTLPQIADLLDYFGPVES